MPRGFWEGQFPRIGRFRPIVGPMIGGILIRRSPMEALMTVIQVLGRSGRYPPITACYVLNSTIPLTTVSTLPDLGRNRLLQRELPVGIPVHLIGERASEAVSVSVSVVDTIGSTQSSMSTIVSELSSNATRSGL